MGPRTAQIGAIGFAIGVTFGAGEGKAAELAGAGRFHAGKDLGPLAVVVVVDDRAKVSPAVLDDAETEAARIYRQAGLKTTWRTVPTLVEGTPSENRRPPTPAFTVQLIIQPEFLGQPPRASEFLMGAAPPTMNECGGSVYVFFDQVAGASNVQRMEPYRVLGAVMAHEIGHRLLRHDGHSSEGLMHAPWNATDWAKASLGLLLFTPSEREAIRATASSCGR
jgi:hypothetical protein